MRNANVIPAADVNTDLEDFAAELAEAVYPIVLRRASVENWLDLKLEIWRALRKTAGKWAVDWPQAGVILMSRDE